jgi:hypothetical protein
MAEVLTRFNVKLSINALKTNALDLSSSTDPLLINWTYSFTNGTGVDQANQFWSDTRSLAATSADNLDLAGVLVSSLGIGSTITFTKIKGIFIKHKTAAASAAMQVGGHATLALLTMLNGTPDLDTAQSSINVVPGGGLALIAPNAAGYIVGTEDMLRIYNGGAASIDYDIVILGCV